MNKTPYPQAQDADIALILEGSYPFVAGGVSAWVHQIIQNFPDYTFALLFLGSTPEDYKAEAYYELPPNVRHLQVSYLFVDETLPEPSPTQANPDAFKNIANLHEDLRCPHSQNQIQMGDISAYLNEKTGVSFKQFLYSKESWDFITQQYEKYCTDPSFIDYFWTIKNIHRPLWQLEKIVNHIPKVKILHAISTGYAGLLGALLHTHYHYPLILTEHGIYTKERRIDLFKSDIVRENSIIEQPLTEIGYLRDLWNRYFEALARLCYETADPIISLFYAAHDLQLVGGAPPKKSRIIPNGVNIEKLRTLRRPLSERPPVVCFLGRIVSIKDVKGFILSIAILREKIPNVKAWIVGAEDEDDEYAKECRELIENLSLQPYVEFKPHQPIDQIFPHIRLLVLNSISESMPLVILESYAAGVPVVATDVGACRELVFGQTKVDQEIGASGRIVKIADPPDLADAINTLLTDDSEWERASQAAIKRVELFYDQKQMIDRYRDIYSKHIGLP